jgi:DME family drug/metabolite transporter
MGAATLFGTIGTARVLGPDVSSVSVGSVRLLAAVLVLVAMAVPVGLTRLLAAWRLPWVWVAGVAQAAFNVTFLAAVSSVGVAVGTLVAIGCTPVLTGLLTRRVSRGWLLATGLALVGLVALLSDGMGDDVSVGGLALAVAAAASYASFIVSSTHVNSAGLPMPTALAAIFTIAAAVLSPALLLTDLSWAVTPGGFAMVTYLALVATVAAYGLFNRGLRTVEPGTAATLGLAEPLVAAILGVVVIGERLSPLSWAGAVVVMLALVVMVRVSRPGRPVRDDRVDDYA